MTRILEEDVSNEYVELVPRQHNILKDKTTTQIVHWAAKDMRPFNIASSESFIQVAQMYIDIGATLGRIDATKITPSDRTVSKRVNKVYSDLLEKIMPEVIEAISQGIHLFIEIIILLLALNSIEGDIK